MRMWEKIRRSSKVRLQERIYIIHVLKLKGGQEIYQMTNRKVILMRYRCFMYMR